ncbi:hypothetical protein TSOC_010244, partial [Tetrabaena socialis]
HFDPSRLNPIHSSLSSLLTPPTCPPPFRPIAALELAPPPPQQQPPSPFPLDSDDEADPSTFRFTADQLGTFSGLAFSMSNCSRALVALAVGNILINAVEEMMGAVSLGDVAFCTNAIIPAALIWYAKGPFEELCKAPDQPHMPLALKGVGRLSLTLQQLAWTSGSVGVVLLLEAAVRYPPIVGVASGVCLSLAGARVAALWWVLQRHTSSGEEVSRTLAALRGGTGAGDLSLPDRAASWLALGALLQAEPSIHKRGHGGKAGGVALLVPSLEESPLGVLLGDGVIHASADMVVEMLEAL